jgi:hypothetical protein
MDWVRNERGWKLAETAMQHFQEILVATIAIGAIALFFGGFVWRLFRGGPGGE